MEAVLIVAVSIVMDGMTNDEILAQRLALLLGTSHVSRYGYDKIKPLLSQDDGTKMHSDTAKAFMALSGERLGV